MRQTTPDHHRLGAAVTTTQTIGELIRLGRSRSVGDVSATSTAPLELLTAVLALADGTLFQCSPVAAGDTDVRFDL